MVHRRIQSKRGSLPKDRNGEKEPVSRAVKERKPGVYSYRNAEVEEEVVYGFLRNCAHTERAGKGSKKLESSKDEKFEGLKQTHPVQ